MSWQKMTDISINDKTQCNASFKIWVKHLSKVNTENSFTLAQYIRLYFYGLFSPNAINGP